MKYPAGLRLKELALHHINVIVIAEETSDAQAINERAVCEKGVSGNEIMSKRVIEGFNVCSLRPLSLFLDGLRLF